MHVVLRASLSLSLLIWTVFPQGRARAADLRLDAVSGYAIAAEILGRPVRLRVDPAASGYILLNPDAVERLGLGGSIYRSRALVGPVTLRGGSNAVRIAIAGTRLRERIGWFDRNVVDGADGVISPEVLPYDMILFALAPERPHERTIEFAMSYTKSRGLFLPHAIRDRTIGVDFSIFRPGSIATASAGALIAAEHNGSWAGESSPRAISFGIERPVRPMALARPLRLGGFALDAISVRTGITGALSRFLAKRAPTRMRSSSPRSRRAGSA